MNRFAFLFCTLVVAAIPAVSPAQTLVSPDLALQRLLPLNSLFQPTNMAFLGPDDILVNQKNNGQVKLIHSGTLQTTPVLDLAVASAQERGLLGMALHPDFAANNLVYLYYTAAATDGGTAIENRISRFTWNGLALSGEEVIYTLPVSTNNIHNGGILRFGPPNLPAADQKLYVIVGDTSRQGKNQNYPAGAAPDNSGNVLRLNPDGSTPIGTERGPFFDVAGSNVALQNMYAFGIRNSFGIDFDPLSNALWDTENGFFDNDEVNRVDPAFNSGWDKVMGFTSSPPPGLVQFGGVGTYSNPEFTWNKIVAPTAIHFYTATGIGTENQFDCFVGSAVSEKLYHFELNPARTAFELSGALADTVYVDGEDDSAITFGNGFGTITDIRTGPDGYLYVLSMSLGTLYRIQPKGAAAVNWNLYE